MAFAISLLDGAALRVALLGVAFCALPVVSASCGDPAGPEPSPDEIAQLPRALTPTEEQAVEIGNGFGLDLLRRLHADREAGESNVFISPLSASMALAMAMNGTDGATFEQMRNALGLEGLTLEEANEAYRGLSELLLELDPGVDIRLANGVWLDEVAPILPDFEARVSEAFDARVENVDFEASGTADDINGWVEENTEGRIGDLVTPESLVDLVALLVNAVYFEGSWTDRFDPAETAPADFRRPDGTTVSVPMMTRTLDAKFTVGEEFAAVDLPYAGRAFSMTVVVPAEGATLDEMVEGVDREWWRTLVEGLSETNLSVSLPRFELTYEKLLNDALVALGMELAFDPMQADFGRLVEGAGPGDFYIDWVKQKSFVRVDEEGTEAAAATGVGVMPTSLPPSLRADRPFLFAIRERLSGTILFVGTVADPTAEE